MLMLEGETGSVGSGNLKEVVDLGELSTGRGDIGKASVCTPLRGESASFAGEAMSWLSLLRAERIVDVVVVIGRLRCYNDV